MEWADYKAKVKEALEKSKFDVAETTLLQALQWVKDTGGSNERLCLCLDQLAWIYVNIKDLDRAAACYKESLEIKQSILGEQNPIVARACKKLATVVYMQKRYDLAERYSKDALNIFKSTLGLEHEETQQTLSDLVSLLRKLNRNIEANILQGMGKQAQPAQSEAQQQGYAMGQTFLRIKVCANCSLPYDGDQCMRCTEGRLVAAQKQAEAIAQAGGGGQPPETVSEPERLPPSQSVPTQPLPPQPTLERPAPPQAVQAQVQPQGEPPPVVPSPPPAQEQPVQPPQAQLPPPSQDQQAPPQQLPPPAQEQEAPQQDDVPAELPSGYPSPAFTPVGSGHQTQPALDGGNCPASEFGTAGGEPMDHAGPSGRFPQISDFRSPKGVQEGAPPPRKQEPPPPPPIHWQQPHHSQSGQCQPPTDLGASGPQPEVQFPLPDHQASGNYQQPANFQGGPVGTPPVFQSQQAPPDFQATSGGWPTEQQGLNSGEQLPFDVPQPDTEQKPAPRRRDDTESGTHNQVMDINDSQ